MFQVSQNCSIVLAKIKNKLKEMLVRFIILLILIKGFFVCTVWPFMWTVLAVFILKTPWLWKWYYAEITNQGHLEILIDLEFPYEVFKKLCRRQVITGPIFKISFQQDLVTNLETGETSKILFGSIWTTVNYLKSE